MRIWVNGALRDEADARVSVFDHGLTVGDGIFETVKTTAGRPFALTRHLDRLTRSARGLGLPDPDLDEVRRACAAVIDANPMELGRLRITYTGGLSPLGSDRGNDGAGLVVALGESTRRHDTTAVITVPWTTSEARSPGSRPLRTRRMSSPSPAPMNGAPRRRSSRTLSGSSAKAPEPTSSSSSTGSCTPRRSPPAASPGSPAHWSSSGRGRTRPNCPWMCWSTPRRCS